MGEVPDGQFLVFGGKPSTGKTSSSIDNRRVILTLEVRPQQEVYPKGVNPLPRVGPHNSNTMGIGGHAPTMIKCRQAIDKEHSR